MENDKEIHAKWEINVDARTMENSINVFGMSCAPAISAEFFSGSTWKHEIDTA